MKPILNLIFNRLTAPWLNIHTSCLLCLAKNKNSKLTLCEDCQRDLPSINQACDCCGLPLPHQGVCGRCLQLTPAFQTIIAPYHYEFPIAQLITKFKYQQQYAIGHLLADLLLIQLNSHYLNGLKQPDYLLAVPLSKKRLKERGFNQAERIGKKLSKGLAIPLLSNTVQRVIDTPPQQSLSAKERYTNLKNAFKIINTSNLTNKHIAIIDDVVTTTTTVNTLAQLLMEAGAKQIDIYAIARTPYTLK